MYKIKNEVFNTENLDTIMKYGCAWCRDKHFTYKDFNEVQWTRNIKHHEFVCDGCSQSTAELKEMIASEGGEYGTIIFRAKETLPFNDQLPKQMLH